MRAAEEETGKQQQPGERYLPSCEATQTICRGQTRRRNGPNGAEIMHLKAARRTIASQAAADQTDVTVRWIACFQKQEEESARASPRGVISAMSPDTELMVQTDGNQTFTFSNSEQICVWGNWWKARLARNKMTQLPQWEGPLLTEPEQNRNQAHIKRRSWEGSGECWLRLGGPSLITLIKVLTVQSATACVNPKCELIQTKNS